MRKLELKWGIILALPAILGFLIWNLGPMIASFVIGFTDWSVAGSPEFIGLANYKEIFFDDFIAKKSIIVTLYFAGGSVIVSMVTAFLAALLLNRKIRALPLFRTIFFLPSIVPAIANAVVWLWLFNPDFGLLNYILEIFGLSRLQWIFFNLVMGLISSFQAFAQPYLMTNGGPNYASMLYCYYIYQNAFQYGRMGYASALSTILFIMILVLTLLIIEV